MSRRTVRVRTEDLTIAELRSLAEQHKAEPGHAHELRWLASEIERLGAKTLGEVLARGELPAPPPPMDLPS